MTYQPSIFIKREAKDEAATEDTGAYHRNSKMESNRDQNKKSTRRIGSYAKLLSRSFSLLALTPIADGMKRTKIES